MTGTVHGAYKQLGGAVAAGQLVITVNTEGQVVRDPVGNVVFQGPQAVKLNKDGLVTLTLPASDDSTLEPSGFTYAIVEQLSHVARTSYRIVEFQVTNGGTIELADLAATDEAALDPSYGANLNAVLAELDGRLSEGDLAASIDAAVAPVVAQAAAAAPVQTRSTAAMSYWLTALAGVRAGVADAKVLAVGDSLTAGIFSGATRATSFPTRVRDRLGALVQPTAPGFDITPNPNSLDPRFTLGSGWAISGGVGPAGLAVYGNPSAAGNYRYTPGYTCDSIDLWVFHGSGRGTFQPKVKGIDWGSPIAAGTGSGWTKHTLSGFSAANDNYFDLTNPSAEVYVLWGEAYLSTQRVIRLGNWGAPGSTSGTWSDTLQSIDLLYAYRAHLTLLCLGMNDANPDTPVAAATYKARMESIITYAQLGGSDVVLITPPQPSTASGRQARVEQYNAALYELAASRDCPLIDLYAKLGPHDNDHTNGLWSDDLHLSAKGYAQAGRLVFDGLTAA